MTYHDCPLDEDEKVYAEGFTNAVWSQRVGLCIPLKEVDGCKKQSPGEIETHEWTGVGEHANPMTGDVSQFKTPKDKKLAEAIKAEFQFLDHGKWTDAKKVNHPQPPIRIGNYTQNTYITEDGGGPDQNDTCMFFRWWKGPLSPTPINPITFPENKTMYVRAFTNSVNYAQRIKITIPGRSEKLVYNGHEEGMEPMEGPASFTLEAGQPTIEFFHVDEKGEEHPSVLSATSDDALDTIHQFTWLARDTEGTDHQTVVLCIYHWDTKRAD